MIVVFPYANSHTISDDDFRAAWAELIRRYAVGSGDTDLPRLHSKDPLSKIINKGHQLSLEYLCRMLVPSGYRNTMQATDSFLEANAHIMQPVSVINPVSGRSVQGAQLIAPPDIEAVFEADVDDLEEVDISSPDTLLSSGPIEWGSYVADFVKGIDSDPYQPMYRGKPVGKPVRGWDKRLQSYFWPNPKVGLVATEVRLKPILSTCKMLATLIEKGQAWTGPNQTTAVSVANDIFKWGGVPQDPKTVTSRNVRKVFEAAITGRAASGTLMNSGWTKVAAFATAHLDTGKPHASPQVIWDSRVSTSIIRRLDNIFHSEDLKSLPTAYASVGLVGGQGGTRKNPPKLKLKWKNGYGRWDAQFAGSAFVRAVCQHLNANGMKMTRPDGKQSKWTVRGVEMVLFGDGY